MLRTLCRARPGIATRARALHTTLSRLAALVFAMPAMSPTMTEGGVVSWKFQPGDLYNAGDILLEVETDKATIDVEAADDGILWQILVNDGAKGVPVGDPIAYIAEQGDDLLSLQAPTTAAAPAAKPAEKAEKPVESKQVEPATTNPKPVASTEIFVPANPLLKLFPSVELLLHEHGISHEQAVRDIKASGPNGRLLLGDVLAHVGSIKQDDIVRVQSFIKTRQHLDLSSITLADAEQLRRLQQMEEPKGGSSSQKADAVAAPVPSNIRSFSLVSVLTTSQSAGLFAADVRSAVSHAIRDVYAAKFPQYATSPLAQHQASSLFDEIVAPSVTQSRFEVVLVQCQEQSGGAAAAPECIFDDLMSVAQPRRSRAASDGPTTMLVDIKVKLDGGAGDAEEFLRAFKRAVKARVSAEHVNMID